MLMASGAVVAATAIMTASGLLIVSRIGSRRRRSDVAICTSVSSRTESVQGSSRNLGQPGMAIAAIHTGIVGNVVSRLSTQCIKESDCRKMALIAFRWPAGKAVMACGVTHRN